MSSVRSLVRLEHLPIGPAFLQGAVERFRFAVLPGMEGVDQDVPGTECGQHRVEIVRARYAKELSVMTHFTGAP